MWFRVLCAGTVIVGMLSACSAINSTVGPRYDTVSRSIASARNESILLNIVRAAHDYPLNFTIVSQANPSMTDQATLGSPQFLLGPNPRCLNLAGGAVGSAGAATCLAVPPSPVRDFIFGGQNQATNQVSVQTQFTLSTQETKEFYQALLRPVDLYVLEYFIRQGYSRELLFWLFADSVVVQNGKKVLGYAYNPPYSFGCAPGDAKHRCFREWAEIATVSGLSVEQQSSTEKKQVLYRLCFDTFLAQQGQSAMQQVTPARMQQLIGKYIDRGLALSPQCGDPWEKVPEGRGADTLNFTVGPNLFKIVPRSAYAIFQLLGKILKDQENHDNDAPLPPGISAEDAAPILTTVLGDQNLVTIVKDANGDCFTETQFVDGHYCVPESAANTKRIFGLLAQLIALQTSATDIAITPTVHTVQ